MDVEEIDLSILVLKDEKKRSYSDFSSCGDICEDVEEDNQPRRSNRKKIRPLELVEKRRVMTRPRKLNINSSTKDIEHYYLDKKIKLSSPALETIFEEPKKDAVMSNRKMRRCIHFNEFISEKPDKNKVKKRSMKAKKIIKGGFKKIGKKLGFDVLMKKLKELDNIEEFPHGVPT